MFNRGKRQNPRPEGQPTDLTITVGNTSLEVDAVTDVTARYPWKGRPVKEIRLGNKAEVFRDIVTNKPEIVIGDDICSYTGDCGFDKRGYYVLVERVGHKTIAPPQEKAAPPEPPRASPAPKTAAPQRAQLSPQPPLVAAPPPIPPPASRAAKPEPTPQPAAPVNYANLTLEEYEAMPMSEAAKVPPDIVERLHAQHNETPTPATKPAAPPEVGGGLDEELRRLFAGDLKPGPEPESNEYSGLTLEEYEAMPMSEAAKVPPEVVEKLRRSSKDVGG